MRSCGRESCYNCKLKIVLFKMITYIYSEGKLKLLFEMQMSILSIFGITNAHCCSLLGRLRCAKMLTSLIVAIQLFVLGLPAGFGIYLWITLVTNLIL